ncbi:MAG TPA: CHAD domain-containing protein [Longimicrobium sp.]|nr:CHAD domain-containing protein [Longimicrobium sp.]
MKPAAGLLDQPADRGARRLALTFMDEAAAAHARLEQGGDDGALHDFRVGLRRLRSTVRAYAQHLGGSVGGKDRRRLGALADATGRARDLEVQAGWVEKRLDGLDGRERPGAERELRGLRADQAKAEDGMRREVLKDFGRVRWKLSQKLRFYRVQVDVDEPVGGPRMSGVLGRLALELTARLKARLDAVESIDDQEEAHVARIAAKRLRYLLEPFAPELEGAPELVKRIKRLQDALGEMHDAHVLLDRLPNPPENDTKDDGDGDADGGGQDDGEGDAPGILALRGAAEEERAARFAELEAEWLHGHGADFFAAARAVAEAARMRGEPDREIERKYLLKRMPAIRRLPYRIQELDQGYLPGERLAERIRRVREGGEVRYYRTVKLGRGISRTEVEEETTDRIFRKMWPLTKGKRVRKRRYKVEDGGFTWEIDRFRDRRLVLCEVELPSEDVDPPIPPWLRREMVREVTDESEFVNINLAK